MHNTFFGIAKCCYKPAQGLKWCESEDIKIRVWFYFMLAKYTIGQQYSHIIKRWSFFPADMTMVHPFVLIVVASSPSPRLITSRVLRVLTAANMKVEIAIHSNLTDKI